MKQNNVVTLAAMKARGEKISQLTCYDYSTARLMDQAGINMILVGDSLGMTMQGYSDTLPVTLEEMILYGRSVARGCRNAFVVLDMPFMSYQVSPEQALANAGRMMKETGVDGVKLSCVQFLVAGLLATVLALLFESFTFSDILAAWVPLLYTGIISSGVGYTLQILGQRTVNPTVASLILSLESVFAVLAGWVLLGQPLSPRELVGCALVFAAVVLAQLPQKKPKVQSE